MLHQWSACDYGVGYQGLVYDSIPGAGKGLDGRLVRGGWYRSGQHSTPHADALGRWKRGKGNTLRMEIEENG